MYWMPLVSALSYLVDPQAAGAEAAQAGPSSAHQAPSHVRDQDPAPVRLEDVIVVGRRGAAWLPPEIELGQDEIDNLGAYDIGEVIARVAENLGYDRPPIIIVNGRQVLNARDFLGFPPDALVRVEALPPQAAATYGEDPSRRVVNIVLLPTFKSRDGLVRASRPTAGGRSSLSMDARQSEIVQNDTRQFGILITRDTSLRAEERSAYIRDHPGYEAATLRPATDAATANFSMTRALGDWSSSLGANARTQTTRFTSMAGGQAVEIRQETSHLNLTGGLGGDVLGWATRFGLNGIILNIEQDGPTQFRSRSLSGVADFSANRAVIDLPAGPMRMSVSGLYSGSETSTETEPAKTRLSAQTLDLRGSLTIPLSQSASAPQQGAGLNWGDAVLTVGGALAGLTGDAGRGNTLNVGFSWSPLRTLGFTGQWSRSTDNPTSGMRIAPVYTGPPRTVFDFLTGESVEVSPILGGNPDLEAQTSQTLSIDATVGPFTRWNVQGRLGFNRARSTDGFGVVPELTPAVEAAFPERFIRDVNGRLVSIDQRMINIGSTLSETLTSGLNFSIPIQEGTPARRGASMQVGLNHTWQLTNIATLRAGLPQLDLLAGDGGGGPRHQISVNADGRYGQWGFNAAARWRSASRIRRDQGRDGPDDLRLSGLTTIDLKLSYLFEAGAAPGGEGAARRRGDPLRLELGIDNLFDARPEASLGDGRPAPGYGRDDQDPLGRTVRISLSRRF